MHAQNEGRRTDNLGARPGWGGQCQSLGALPPGKETRYPLRRTLGGPRGRSGQVQKISPSRDSNFGP